MGEIFSNEIFDMGNGLCFIDSKSSLNAPMSVETTQSGKRLVITFGVSGSSIYKNHGDKKTILFCSGCTTITLFNDTKGVREISSGELRQNRIVMSEEFLRRNFSDIVKKFDKENLNLIKFSPANPRSLAFLNAIHSPKFSGKLSDFYIQSKILRLLCEELGAIGGDTQMPIDEYDKKALHRARDILLSSLSAPPSVVELAKIVHLNEVKFKQGFKLLFGDSPYRYLIKFKMAQAKKMLESGEFNIDETARALGYKFSNNFTVAFYKEFGVLPKEIMKNSRFYYNLC